MPIQEPAVIINSYCYYCCCKWRWSSSYLQILKSNTNIHRVQYRQALFHGILLDRYWNSTRTPLSHCPSTEAFYRDCRRRYPVPPCTIITIENKGVILFGLHKDHLGVISGLHNSKLEITEYHSVAIYTQCQKIAAVWELGWPLVKTWSFLLGFPCTVQCFSYSKMIIHILCHLS